MANSSCEAMPVALIECIAYVVHVCRWRRDGPAKDCDVGRVPWTPGHPHFEHTTPDALLSRCVGESSTNTALQLVSAPVPTTGHTATP